MLRSPNSARQRRSEVRQCPMLCVRRNADRVPGVRRRTRAAAARRSGQQPSLVGPRSHGLRQEFSHRHDRLPRNRIQRKTRDQVQHRTIRRGRDVRAGRARHRDGARLRHLDGRPGGAVGRGASSPACPRPDSRLHLPGRNPRGGAKPRSTRELGTPRSRTVARRPAGVDVHPGVARSKSRPLQHPRRCRHARARQARTPAGKQRARRVGCVAVDQRADLVLHGTDDLLSPVDNAPLLAERIPDARVRLLPGARHAYFEEEREVASTAAISFLAGH